MFAFQNIDIGGGSMVGYFVGFGFVLAVFAALNALFLRWATQLVVKQNPDFGKAFLRSFIAAIGMFVASFILGGMLKSPTASVGDGGSLPDLLGIVPFLVFLGIIWFQVSAYQTIGPEKREIGNGKSIAIVGLNGVFLLVVSTVMLISDLLSLARR